MLVQDFNTNTSRHLKAVVDSGTPKPVLLRHKPWVTVVPTSLFEDLVDALGADADAILDAHRERAANAARPAEEPEVAVA